MPLQKIGDEEIQLSVSLKEPQIIKLGHIEPLKEVLRYVMVLTGLRAQNWPNEEEKAVLLDFIRNNYGGHTISEIKLAFTMAINGTLGLPVSEVKTYENFSVLYFSSIMNAYREWAKEAIKHIPQPKPVELPAPEVPDAEFIQTIKNLFQQSGGNWRIIPELAYKILEPEMGLTKEKKSEIYQHIMETTKEGDIPFLCRQYAVALYFTNQL